MLPPAPLHWLDTRRRAMLGEIGIRLWPAKDNARLETAPEMIAARAGESRLSGTFGLKKPAVSNPDPGIAAAPVAPLAPTAQSASWTLGPVQPLQTAGSITSVDPACATLRWLVLCEAESVAVDLGAGAAGQLLANMLQAVQAALPRLAGKSAMPMEIQIATWAAQPANSVDTPPVSNPGLHPVAQAVADFQPDTVLLLMGRSAALALLQAATQPTPDRTLAAGVPFNQLRSQRHRIAGCTAVVSHDLQSLLRTPARKAQAWEDLCQALRLGCQAAAVRWAAAGQKPP